MAKFNLDKGGELKKLAEEFERMATAENLQEANEAVATETREQQARARGALPRRTTYLVIATVAVLLTSVVILLISRHGAGDKFVTVPNVVGQDITSARDTLLAGGFRIKEDYDPTSKAAPGKVTAQDVPAGTKIQSGGNVIITVAGKAPGSSSANRLRRPQPVNGRHEIGNPGPAQEPTPARDERVTMPNIVGLDTEQARKMLDALGLRVEARTVVDNTQKAGVVIASDPNANSAVARGALVRISVNAATVQPAVTEQPSHQITIPDYFGKASQATMDDLRAKGLAPSWRMETSQQLRSGYVMRTEPPTGAKVDPGTRVTVIIAR